MIGLKTNVEDLTVRKLRDITKLILSWCENNIGISKYRPYTPDFSIQKMRSKYSPTIGIYDSDQSKIIIYRHQTKTIKDFIKVVIHEYTHHTQDLRNYNKVLKEVGYNDHPNEIEAEKNELLYSECWKKIKYNSNK